MLLPPLLLLSVCFQLNRCLIRFSTTRSKQAAKVHQRPRWRALRQPRRLPLTSLSQSNRHDPQAGPENNAPGGPAIGTHWQFVNQHARPLGSTEGQASQRAREKSDNDRYLSSWTLFGATLAICPDRRLDQAHQLARFTHTPLTQRTILSGCIWCRLRFKMQTLSSCCASCLCGCYNGQY